MTNPNLDRIELTPKLIEMYARYRWENPAWGSLHVVLDDGNYEDSCVEHCWGHALTSQDYPGVALARTLLMMTRSQRSKVGRKAEEWLDHWWRFMLNMSRSTGAYYAYKANMIAGYSDNQHPENADLAL